MLALTKRFEDALAYATRLHATQRRNGTEVPYVSHVLGVASLTLEHGGDEDQAIAALLHDALEDHPDGGRTRATILADFGAGVLDIVVGCSDTTGDGPKLAWRERKEAYLEHLADASPRVRLVSACDKLHNARAIVSDYGVLGEGIWQRFTGKKRGVLWYYGRLAETFATGLPAALTKELARTVATMLEASRDKARFEVLGLDDDEPGGRYAIASFDTREDALHFAREHAKDIEDGLLVFDHEERAVVDELPGAS